jgi:glycosyltransferase involved in cell wall biosynthesis
MAYSCPIVATAVGGIPGIIRDGEEGLLVPHGDIEALSGALERILNNGGMARKLAVNASLRLASDFSAQEMTHRTEEVYGEMLSRMRSGER